MRTPKLVVTLMVFVLITIQWPAFTANGQSVNPNLYYLPFVSKVIPPEKMGPFGGPVVSIAQDPINPGVAYAGGFYNGVYKTYDHGVSWYPASSGIDNLEIQAVAISRSNPNVVYAGTYYDSRYYSGVYKSSDGGVTWKQTGTMVNIWNGYTLSSPVVYAIAVDPTNSDLVYAGTRMFAPSILPCANNGACGGGGVFRSTDGGTTWAPFNAGLAQDDLYAYDLDIDLANHSVYVAMHGYGPYVLKNGSTVWQSLTHNGLPDDSGRGIRIDPSNHNTLFYSSWHTQGVYISNDAGTNWYTSGLGGYHVWQLGISSANANLVYASTWQATGGPIGGAFGSNNHGASWRGLDVGKVYYQIAPDPFQANTVLGGTRDYGVMRTDNYGSTWSGSNYGFSARPVQAIAVSQSQPPAVYAAVAGVGVMKTTDGGMSWTSVSSGLPAAATVRSLAINPTNNAVIFATTDYDGSYLTTNGAGTWTAINAGYPASPQILAPQGQRTSLPPLPTGDDIAQPKLALASTTYPQGLSLAISPANSGIVLMGTNGRGLVRYNGAGGWTASSLTSGSVNAILFDSVGTLSASVYAGVDGAHGGFLASNDNGLTWTAPTSALSNQTVYSLSQDATTGNQDTFFAGTGSGVYQSKDHGVTWTLLTALNGEPVKAVQTDPWKTGVVMAATYDELYLSKDGGATWSPQGSILREMGFESILPSPVDPNFYYLATCQGGVVRINP